MKKWYLSKTLYINIIAIVAMIVQSRYNYIISPEAQMVVLAEINLVLRLITKEKIEW